MSSTILLEGSIQDRTGLIADLRELVKALDRRVPRFERAGEEMIGREAAALRAKAVARIVQLESPAPR